MTCDICSAPAHHVYAEGDLPVAFCDPCDRAGAEDVPMESGLRVALVGAVLIVAIVVGLVLLPAVQR